MKVRKIESLKKNVFLIDNPDKNTDYYRDFLPNGNWELLGKLKDLTEYDCEPLVEKYLNGQYCYFKNYNQKGVIDLWVKNEIESFLSALEAEGFHLNGNPFGDMEPDIISPPLSWDSESLEADKKKWQEAEQNVFSQESLVFVEL